LFKNGGGATKVVQKDALKESTALNHLTKRVRFKGTLRRIIPAKREKRKPFATAEKNIPTKKR